MTATRQPDGIVAFGREIDPALLSLRRHARARHGAPDDAARDDADADDDRAGSSEGGSVYVEHLEYAAAMIGLAGDAESDRTSVR